MYSRKAYGGLYMKLRIFHCLPPRLKIGSTRHVCSCKAKAAHLHRGPFRVQGLGSLLAKKVSACMRKACHVSSLGKQVCITNAP